MINLRHLRKNLGKKLFNVIKNNKKRRVVITGIGVLTPNGIGKDIFWKANIRGESGIGYIKCFDTSKHTIKIGGEITNFNPTSYMSADVARKADRFAQLGIAASQMAIRDSMLDLDREDSYRVGISMGSGLGGVLFHEEEMIAMLKRKMMESQPFTVPKVSPNAIAGHVSIIYKIKGPNISISTACSSGAHAIGQALEIIRNNRADVMIAGGAEAPLTPFTFGAFSSTGAMSKRNDNPKEASRPFDKERDGFVMSEGAGIVILEELEHAKRRQAPIYAELIGYGMANSAYHMVIPNPDGEDAEKTMIFALQDAGVDQEDIDYINAHGTSTQQNDKVETLAIKKVFGSRAFKIPVSSTKSMIGHSIGASGAIELVVCILALQNNMIPPTINYKTSDPECDLDYVPNIARKAKLNTILSNSFAFGGNNASLILRRI